MTQPRSFTAAEADALLPAVRDLLETMRESLAFLRHAGAGAGRGWEPPEQPSPHHAWAIQRLEGAQHELAVLEVEIRDVDRGLVDFPALHAGRPVLLCWLEGEERVSWFHDPEAGFGGRRPLAELEEQA